MNISQHPKMLNSFEKSRFWGSVLKILTDVDLQGLCSALGNVETALDTCQAHNGSVGKGADLTNQVAVHVKELDGGVVSLGNYHVALAGEGRLCELRFVNAHARVKRTAGAAGDNRHAVFCNSHGAKGFVRVSAFRNQCVAGGLIIAGT